MIELVGISDAQAGAIAETAKFGTSVVTLIGNGARRLARVLGSVPEDAVGLLGGDWLHETRQRVMAMRVKRSAEMLAGFAPERLSEPSPAIIVPLMTAAANESRQELGEMWAALLARAFIDQGRQVRRDFFDTLRQMEPEDAALLTAIQGFPFQGPPGDHQGTTDNRAHLGRRLGAMQIAEDRQKVALSALYRFNCIFFPLAQAPAERALPPPEMARVSPFGREFLAACTAPV